MQLRFFFSLLATVLATLQDEYDRSKADLLNGQYDLYWTVNSSHLKLAIQADTTGWVGFGVAEWSMAGADIVFAGVVDGEVEVVDTFATSKSTPKVDAQQDWVVVSGVEEAGKTTVHLVRALNTGDGQDRVISGANGGLQLVVAMSNDGSDTPGYHGANRENVYLDVFGTGVDYDALRAQYANNSDIVKVDMAPQFATPKVAICKTGCDEQQPINTTAGFPVPSSPRTIYVDWCFDVVAELRSQHGQGIDEDWHIVLLDHYYGGTEADKTLHHFVYTGSTVACGQAGGDEAAMAGWASGNDALALPSNVGFRAGGNSIKSIWINAHYDNPSGTSGLVDTSGIHIYLTKTLREFDAGVLIAGDPRVRISTLPEHMSTIGSGPREFVTRCPSQQTASMEHEKVTIMAVSEHMHFTGIQFGIKITRQDGTEAYHSYSEYYEPELQPFYEREIELHRGDAIEVTCVFDDVKAIGQTPVTFGEGSDQEMCMSFLVYYPRDAHLESSQGACGLFTQPGLTEENALSFLQMATGKLNEPITPPHSWPTCPEGPLVTDLTAVSNSICAPSPAPSPTAPPLTYVAYLGSGCTGNPIEQGELGETCTAENDGATVNGCVIDFWEEGTNCQTRPTQKGEIQAALNAPNTLTVVSGQCLEASMSGVAVSIMATCTPTPTPTPSSGASSVAVGAGIVALAMF